MSFWFNLWWRCWSGLGKQGMEKSNKTSESYWMSFNKSLRHPTHLLPVTAVFHIRKQFLCRVSLHSKSIIFHQSSPACELFVFAFGWREFAATIVNMQCAARQASFFSPVRLISANLIWVQKRETSVGWNENKKGKNLSSASKPKSWQTT